MRSSWIMGSALASVLGVGTAAAENGVYAGAALGEVGADIAGGPDAVFDTEDAASKVIVGWRPLDWIAVEGSYLDLGEVTQTQNFPDFSDFNLEQTGHLVSGVFLWDIALVDLFAKVGVVRWSADLSVSTFAGPVQAEDDGTELAWGVGAQARFGKLAVRLEYERFDIDTIGGIEPPEMISVGLTWTF